MRQLPSGTVTFLFTDIEGSTRLLEELGGEAYAAVLAEHHRVCRQAWAAHNGVEVETEGDAFFVVFERAGDALAAAGKAQEALAEGPVRVRMGLHTGEVLLTETGYVGRELHLAARIAASGHGGQVVVSEATRTEAGDGYELVELGEHRFKDFEQPLPLFQLGEGSFPPLKTVSNTNLPRPASSFVGREQELVEVLARIEHGARLVTLTGPGGSGKTRLAIEAAATLVPEYKAGVFWVGLAALRDPALVTATIAQTLGAKNGLAEHVGERELLLLLDNLEQVIEAAPELSALVSTCPNLALLVTSRELLRIQGEIEYAVPPLAQTEAVALFCERAQTQPSDEITDLCARLDHLPLAVELAAARTKALTPAQIVERLSQRLDLFKGGRDSDPRQQTLRATIEWSHDLLSEDERDLFGRLSVFDGGCTLEAAEKVADADLDTMQSLVEKSLLRFTDERYWMLETIREYAVEQGAEAAERDATLRRHAEYFMRLIDALEAGTAAASGATDFQVLAREEPNLRLALEWALANDAEQALRMAAKLGRFWFIRGNPTEGRMWLGRALASAGESVNDDVLRIVTWAASMASIQGDRDSARELAERGIEVAGELGDNVGRAGSLSVLGNVLTDEARFAEARAALEESATLFREAEDDAGLASTLNNLADLSVLVGDIERAAVYAAEGLGTARRINDAWQAAISLFNLGLVALHRNENALARQRFLEGLPHVFEASDRRLLYHFLEALAKALEDRDDPELSARLLGTAAALGESIGAVLEPSQATLHEDLVARLLTALGPDRLDDLWREGTTADAWTAAADLLTLLHDQGEAAASISERQRGGTADLGAKND